MVVLQLYRTFTDKPYYFGALGYVFLAPFLPLISTVAMVAWLALSLLSYRKGSFNKNPLLLLLPAIFLVYILGMLWFHGVSFSILQHKLSLLVFPLLLSLHYYNMGQRRTILRFFVYGLLYSSIVCLCFALFRSLSFYDGSLHFAANVLEGKGFLESVSFGGNYFFGKYFSVFHQTVYFALYLCIGIAFLMFGQTDIKDTNRSMFITFFILIIFLVSNKASLIALALLFLLKLAIAKYGLAKKLVLLVTFVFGLVIMGYTNPRMMGSIKKLAKGELKMDKKARYDFKTRLLSWDAAIDLIKQSPIFGYGASNTQKEMDRMYEKKGYVFPLRNSYNAHNQFLQMWLENGLLGLVLFLSVFAALLITAWGDSESFVLVMAVVFLLFFNALFESYFNRFSGISFFSFIVSFYLSKNKNVKT